MEEKKVEKNIKETKKQKLSVDATVLLTLAATTCAIVVFRIMYFLIAGV